MSAPHKKHRTKTGAAAPADVMFVNNLLSAANALYSQKFSYLVKFIYD